MWPNLPLSSHWSPTLFLCPHQSLGDTNTDTLEQSAHHLSRLGRFFLASSHKSTQALPTSPAAHPWCPSHCCGILLVPPFRVILRIVSHIRSTGVPPRAQVASVTFLSWSKHEPQNLRLPPLEPRDNGGLPSPLTVPLRPMLKRDTPPSRTLAPGSVQMSTSLNQLPISKSNSSAKGIGHILPRPDHQPVQFFFCVRARLQEGPCFSARVIVQCVVSLLFLVIQSTHSAFVNARPVARAWNLALRLTSSALGQQSTRGTSTEE